MMKKLLLLLISLIVLSSCGSGNQAGGASSINPAINANTDSSNSSYLKGLSGILPYNPIANLNLPVDIPQPTWYTQVGTSTITKANAVTSDGMGNVYIVGSTNFPLYFNQKGLYDYFVVRYDSSGGYTALAQVGAPGGTTVATGVTTDNKGYIYVTGYTNVGISGQVQTGKNDYFIAKYPPSGAVPMWTKQVGAINGNTYATGIKFDSNTLGDIYISGYTDKVISGGVQTGKIDSFLARYDTNGNFIWFKQNGEVNTTTKAAGVSIDSHDNIYVAGDINKESTGLIESYPTNYYISQYNSSGNLNWKRSVGSEGVTQTYATAADGYDTAGIYVVGSTTRGLSGESQTGNADYFIAQYNINGVLQWSRQVGASGGITKATSVSADNFGNVYITGTTNKAISGQSLYGNTDSFIARYDRSGNLQWTEESGNPNADYEASGISNGKNGNIFVTGLTNFYMQVHKYKNYFLVEYDSLGNAINKTLQLNYSPTVAYGINADGMGNVYIAGSTMVGLSGQVQTGGTDYFIAKYDNAESLVWTRQLGGNNANTTSGASVAYGVSADNFGNVYIAGYTSVSLPSGEYIPGIYYFIAKYDSSGNLIWVKPVGSSNQYLWCNIYARGISTDNLGNIYITGQTNGALSNGKQNGINDYFIAKYDSNGNMLWTKQVGASGGYTLGYGIKTDNIGNSYITGWTNVGISGQKQNGYDDYFIAKYDTNGNLIWSRQDGAAFGYGVSSDNLGNIYITGMTATKLSNHVPLGYQAYFIAKYDINGNLIWTNQIGTAKTKTSGSGISADSFGNIYVTGYSGYAYDEPHFASVVNYFVAKHDGITGKLLWITRPAVMRGYALGNGISTDSFGNVFVTGYTSISLFGQVQNGATDYFIAKYRN